MPAHKHLPEISSAEDTRALMDWRCVWGGEKLVIWEQSDARTWEPVREDGTAERGAQSLRQGKGPPPLLSFLYFNTHRTHRHWHESATLGTRCLEK